MFHVFIKIPCYVFLLFTSLFIGAVFYVFRRSYDDFIRGATLIDKYVIKFLDWY